MNLHFGQTTAQRDGLYLDFATQKREYQRMQAWNPAYKEAKLLEKGEDEATITELTEKLLAKSKAGAAFR